MSIIPNGTLVRIKPYKELCEIYKSSYCSSLSMPGGWLSNMQSYCGNFFTISSVFSHNRDIYRLNNTGYVWHKDSFNIIESKKGNVFSI